MSFLKLSSRIAGTLLAATVICVIGAPGISGAITPTLYAAVTAAGTGNCSSVANACTLTTAITDVTAGGTILLVTSGVEGTSSTYYEGQFTIDTSGTSSVDPVTIEPLSVGTTPILDGGGVNLVLLVDDMYLDISGVTIQNGSASNGGGIDVAAGANVTVDDSTFSDNNAWGTYPSGNGGAIDIGDFVGSTTLTVNDSTFSHNTSAVDGGAIDSGNQGGSGNLTVTDSTFNDNSAALNADGGAIDSGDSSTSASTLSVTDSTFSGNSAGDGGAIDNADFSGSGSFSVADSTFADNTAQYDGGAIDNGDDTSAGGTLTVSESTFAGNRTTLGDGGAIDNADFGGLGSMSIGESTFSTNSASSAGQTIDNGDNGSAGGTATVTADVFAGSCVQAAGTANSWTDDDYNVGSDATCFNGGANDSDSVGPSLASYLGPLADNGGPTETMALLNGNPAIGLIPTPTSGLCPVLADQRGDSSPFGQPCDAGAVQLTLPLGGAYTAVTPYRICDTRGANGLSGTDAQCAGHTLAARGTLTLQVSGTNPSGSSSGGVPADGVSAVVLNVTATGESSQGFITVWPADQSQPTASSLNYQANKSVPNLVTVELSATGQVSFYSLQSTNLVVDVEGYYATPSNNAGFFHTLTPYRICDTRGTNGLSGTDAQCAGHPLSSGTALTIQVTGTNPVGTSSGGVPSSDVSAVVLNVTAIGHGTGYVTAYPLGVSAPTASNLNFSSGQVVPNRVIVPVSDSGQISLISNTSADLVVDVNGWFTNSSSSGTGGLFVAASPSRICDTRSNGNTTPCAGGTITGPNHLNIEVAGEGPVPAEGAVAVVANLTATDTTAQSFLTAWPTGQTQPTASDLNWVAGLTVPNMAVVGLGTSGDISVYVNSGNADVIVDVTGYYVNAT